MTDDTNGNLVWAIISLIARREKQLKRMIWKARLYHRLWRFLHAIVDSEYEPPWHRWPEEKPPKPGTYLLVNDDCSEPLAAEYDTREEPGDWLYLGWPVSITYWRELPPGPEGV